MDALGADIPVIEEDRKLEPDLRLMLERIRLGPGSYMNKSRSGWGAGPRYKSSFSISIPWKLMARQLRQIPGKWRVAASDTIDYNYTQMKASGYAWPVIDMHLRYVDSARFGQRLKVRAEIAEWENRLRIDYLITDAASGHRLLRGSTTQWPSI